MSRGCSTTQMTPSLRPGSAQMAHGSTSVMFWHSVQNTIWSTTAAMAAERARASSLGARIKW